MMAIILGTVFWLSMLAIAILDLDSVSNKPPRKRTNRHWGD